MFALVLAHERRHIWQARQVRTAKASLEAAAPESRASAASEPRERSAPAQRRASVRAGESEGRSPSDNIRS